MSKKLIFLSLARVALLTLAVLTVILSFISVAQTQTAAKEPGAQSKQVNPTAEDYADFMEYWLIFNQTIGETSQKKTIEVIYPKAIRELEDFTRRKPQSRWAIEAKMRMAEIHQLSSIVMFPGDPTEIKLNKNWRKEAGRWLLEIVKNHPGYLYFNAVTGTETGKSAAAWALYYLAIWNNDPTYLQQLLDKYPESEHAKIVAKNFGALSQNLKERDFYEKLTRAIETGREELQKIQLKHSPRRIKCLEVRRQSNGSKTKHIYNDFAWKEIALKVFNLVTNEAMIIKAKKTGQDAQSLQPEFVVTIEPRPSGILWNGRNTAYKVVGVNGSKWVVVLNKFPNRLKNGKRKDSIYAPHSTALARRIIVENGKKYLSNQIMFTLFELGRLAVKIDYKLEIIEKGSGTLITGAIERLALMEHADYFEFTEFKAGRWPHNPFERVFAILALNGPEAYSSTGSPAQAKGLMQATNRWRRRKPGTWDMIRREYPWAKLLPFETGSADHRQSIKFAILLQDYHFRKLIEAFGPEIVGDPELEHKLAAMYNGGPKHVIEAIHNSRRRGTSWRDELRKLKKTTENLDYLGKLDYLLGQSK